MERSWRHVDCRNYAPVDVVKGICHVKKQVVLAGESSCETFDKLPKCSHCQHYLAGEREYLGKCTAVASQPMAYPDMTAVTCEDFVWKPSSS